MMASSSSIENHEPQRDSKSSSISIPDVDVQALHVSGYHEVPASAVQVDENKEIVITHIRARDVALGLGRFPAGFYAAVHHSGLEWRTKVKRVSISSDVVEWRGPIPMYDRDRPSDPSKIIGFVVYATFELRPTLGDGEQLRKFSIAVENLLERSTKDLAFTFYPKDGEIVSPCSSLSVTVKKRSRQSGKLSASMLLEPHFYTGETPDELGNATNRGHSALSRYRKHGEKRDLERAIEGFERALNLCPWNHVCHAAAQSNVAMAKFIRYRVDNMSNLDIPLTLYCNALSVRPVGHPDRCSTLIQLATVHFARFEKRQNRADAVQAEALLDEAKKLSAVDSHQNRIATFLLRLYVECKTGVLLAGNQSSTERELTPADMDEDPLLLGIRLLKHFERFGGMDELQRAISILEKCVSSTSIWGRRYPAVLAGFGVALTKRFDQLGELGDLEQGVSRLKDAVGLTPDHDPDKPGRLNNLGRSLQNRFERIGKIDDLEQAISMLSDAVKLTHDCHPHRPVCLDNLGNTFLARFERFGDLGDLEQAMSKLRDAVKLTPNRHPKRPGCLNSLGNSFLSRFNCIGDLGDLEQSVSTLKDAVELTPNGHPNKPDYLNNLGNSLLTRFEHVGELGDLEQAISTLDNAVELTRDYHPHRPGCLNNLGNSLLIRFQRIGELSDLEQAISRFQDAVELTPEGHPHKLGYLNSLGESLRARFHRVGELGDLEQAISRLKDVIELTPDHHPEKSGRLNNLGISLRARFCHVGGLGDLEQAISKLRDAVELTPDHHPHKLLYLYNLGGSFKIRFQHVGELGDLEQAISMLKDVARLTPDGHPHKLSYLDDLGNSFLLRFNQLGELSDLEQAIAKFRDVVELTPNCHPDKASYLNNLGNSLRARYERVGELGDLEQAISKLRDAAELTPDGCPAKPGYLNNLGNSLRARFHCVGDLGDLERAISRLRNAVELTPGHHLEKPGRLNNLGLSLKARFHRVGELGDLEQAISRLRDAVELTPDRHPYKLHCLVNLGDSFMARFGRIRELGDLERAMLIHSRAAHYPTGFPSLRFRASKHWALCARYLGHHSLLDAYSSAIQLFPQIAWIGTSLTTRYHELIRGAGMVQEAAAAALDAGRPQTTVEWLEQGRSVIWGGLFELRSSFEQLESVHPELAYKLRDLSAALEYAGAMHEKTLSLLVDSASGNPRQARETLEKEIDRHLKLAIDRDQVLKEIRELPGFERFLLHKEFSQLRAAAHSGPVVILNAAESRCDALIVLADVDDVAHVPLPSINLERLEALCISLKNVTTGVREGRPMPVDYETNWKSILSTLWKSVVKPVLDTLRLKHLTRIFWCPTGPFTFLPIHAAGLYDEQHSHFGHRLPDLVISSYIPTLDILARSHHHDTTHNEHLRLLAVGQPQSDGLFPLPGVAEELGYIREVIQSSSSAQTTLLESTVGTVEEVLELMKEADWVHFACHGTQDDDIPTNSGLCLADGRRLKLSDMIGLSRPRGGLAFLSACETAMGDKALSDEAIHIAAGMLFAGFESAVATMWPISDKIAPCVARDVYEQLFRNGDRPDSREAARALQDAVRRIRESGASFKEWIPFIHVGL